MIKRLKTQHLIDILNYFPVLGIVGPRQVGKTTLSKLIADTVNKEVIYIDLENPKDQAKLNDPILFFENNENKCVILDEIQRMPELFPILRSMIDQNRVAGRFMILGSASPDLIRDSSESLAGRIAYEELYPFNYLEVSEAIELNDHWIKGGYPDAILAPNDKIRNVWIQNFVQTYVERDLPLLGLNIDRKIIKNLWSMTAHINGNVLNMSNLGKSLELSSVTIKKYLNFLEEAFLIRQLQPFSINLKKRLVKSPKVYVRDSGVLHYLLDIVDMDKLAGHPGVGGSWEGYVIEQICQVVGDDYDPYFYRTQEGAECDLVLVKSNIPIYGIEIKYTSSPKLTKGLRNSFSDLKTKKNFIITPNSDDYLIEESIRVCSLKDFLNNHLKIV